MLTNQSSNSPLSLWVGLAGVGIGILIGILTGAQPLFLTLAVGAIPFVFLFFAKFEQTVIGLLILRSALDPFSDQQVPAAFALGLDALILLYVVVALLTGRIVRTDRFWWLFAGWVALQGLWVIFIILPVGGMEFDSTVLLDSIREWVRLFSWLMVYLLVMQLKDRIHPRQIIFALFFALVIPLTVAFMQVVLPASLLPSVLQGTADPISGVISRVNGTLGLSNTFATFLLLFIGLTYWQLGQSQRRWPWLVLLGLLCFFYVSTKALFSLMMLGVFILVLIAPRLNIINLIAGVLLFGVVIALFASTEFGQQRLHSLLQTPLFNPDMDISRALILSKGDNNSFNWRLSQWSYLLQAWQESPFFGHGLATSRHLTIYKNYAHNDYMMALVEGGVVGFIIFLTFLGAQVTRLVYLLHTSSNKAQQKLCWVLLAMLLSILVGMITENIWTHTTLFFYWWTLFAVAAWNWNQSEHLDNSMSQ
ncbi:MAG: O-antigen ligase family protein [Desmonostoc vinosum HA7617-LM4]|jgi:O-antigen ligase|nr:O-antigen ligase family protein [Desmonostoc vinosum HA7617-LM4]